MRFRLLVAIVFLSAGASNCGQPDGDGGAATLYRNSPTVENARIHIATFDAADGAAYNWENCTQAQALFQAQPGVTAKFWCEKGRYRK